VASSCILRRRESSTARTSPTDDYPVTQFTFLGYTFRPRRALDKYGRLYVNFSPGVSREALQAMRQTVRSWHLQLMSDKELHDLSNMFGPVLRGWSNYYGRFYPTALNPLWRSVNAYLVRWLRRKYKHLARAFIARSGARAARRRLAGCIRALDHGHYPRLADGSRMSCEVHVRFCEGLGLQCPGLLTPISAPGRAGCIWLSSWICSRARSSVGCGPDDSS